jgi:hypothetical protein
VPSMMRRLTSVPNPAALVCAITSSALPLPTRSPNRMPSKRARFDEHSLGAIR